MDKQCCIDYFKFRFDNFVDMPDNEQEYMDDCKTGHEPGTADFVFINELCHILLLKPWERLDNNGFQGYSLYSTFGEDVMVFGGRVKECSEDGIPRFYVELKGQACRSFELRCLAEGKDVWEQWSKLFNFIEKWKAPSLGRNVCMKRIDTTIDNFSNSISIDDLQHKLRKGYYITKSRALKINLDYDQSEKIEFDRINEIITDGWTAYVGKPGISRQLCIYDKKAEREYNDNIVTVDHWMRFEGRFYHNNADVAFYRLYNNVFKIKNYGNLFSTIGGLINAIITFKEDNNFSAHNQSSAENWIKWIELLEDDGGNPIVPAKVEKDITFQKAKNWLVNSPFMNITLEFLGDANFHYEILGDSLNQIVLDDIIPDKFKKIRFIQFINFLLKRGMEKLDYPKLAKVNAFRRAFGQETFKCVEDAKKLISQYIGDNYSYGFSLTDYNRRKSGLDDDEFIEGVKKGENK